MVPKFIVDLNVGRLAKWLRVTGFDTLFLKGIDDNRLIRVALEEGRVVLTRDRQIAKRRLVTSGRLKVILIEDDDVREQLRQVVSTLNLSSSFKPFTLCLARYCISWAAMLTAISLGVSASMESPTGQWTRFSSFTLTPWRPSSL